MSTEIEDLQRRVDRLEKSTASLRSSLELVSMTIETLNTWRATVSADERVAEQARLPADGSAPRWLEPMLRSVLLRQDVHTADLGKAVRYLEMIVEREDS